MLPPGWWRCGYPHCHTGSEYFSPCANPLTVARVSAAVPRCKRRLLAHQVSLNQRLQRRSVTQKVCMYATACIFPEDPSYFHRMASQSDAKANYENHKVQGASRCPPGAHRQPPGFVGFATLLQRFGRPCGHDPDLLAAGAFWQNPKMAFSMAKSLSIPFPN